MERQPKIDIPTTLQNTVIAVYDLVEAQILPPTAENLQFARIASERIDKGYHMLREVLSPSQVIGMIAREILMKKRKATESEVAEANHKIRKDLKEIHDTYWFDEGVVNKDA